MNPPSLKAEHHGRLLWWGVCILLAGPAIWLPTVDLNLPSATWPAWIQPLALHPEAGWQQTWPSWWSTAWLHGSGPHLWRNLAGTALLGAMGWLISVRPTAGFAWLVAWPLTHVGMLWRPELSTYIGLSGVLHAGAAILALQQIMLPDSSDARRAARIKQSGWILLTGLTFKVLMENPWGPVLILSSASAIKVAPWAHLSGLMAGLACGGVFFVWNRSQHPQFKRQ
ncbi:MAG TPA: hypothetical protein VFM48_09685 [Aquabacterium sp.]|nr:hypothetical protein [Aquabacterium sp.]